MDSNSQPSNRVKTLVIIMLSAVILIGALAWAVGKSDKNDINKFSTSNVSDKADVKSLVSYGLPPGWKEVDCGTGDLIYILPTNAVNQDCTSTSNPDTLISVSVKDQVTDCKQLQNVSSVKKHICSSVFIDGRKTVKSTTEYLANANESGKTILNYYINTGKSVVRVQYVHHTDNAYQEQFDSLANSVKVKT